MTLPNFAQVFSDTVVVSFPSPVLDWSNFLGDFMAIWKSRT